MITEQQFNLFIIDNGIQADYFDDDVKDLFLSVAYSINSNVKDYITYVLDEVYNDYKDCPDRFFQELKEQIGEVDLGIKINDRNIDKAIKLALDLEYKETKDINGELLTALLNQQQFDEDFSKIEEKTKEIMQMVEYYYNNF